LLDRRRRGDLSLPSRPGTPSTDDLAQPDIAHDPQAVAVSSSVEPPVEEPATLNPAVPEALITESHLEESINDFELVDHADKTFEFIESESHPLQVDPAAEAQEAAGPSSYPLAQPITSSSSSVVVVVQPTLSPPVEEQETQSPKGYYYPPPPVIDSTAGNPGAVTDHLPQPDIAQQDPQTVEPHVEPATKIVDKKSALRSLVDFGTYIRTWLLTSILFHLKRRW